MIVNPATTCALVVGIAEYGLGTDWTLTGARAGAERFADWLKSLGLSSQRIYLRLDAKSDDILRTLRDMKDERTDCDCLVLYWAGHGFATEFDDRGLFVADAFDFAPRAFRIDQIIDFFRHEAPQLVTQLGFIDACATGRREAQAVFQSILMNRQLPQGPLDCNFVLATPGGLDIAYPKEGEPSVFTERLLALLNAGGLERHALLESLKKDYPIYLRDGRSPAWLGSRAQSEAFALESEVRRLGSPLNLRDTVWRAEARRLDPGLNIPDATFRDIVEKISGLKSNLAQKMCVALLLRGEARAEELSPGTADIRDAIRRSRLLAPAYEEGARIVANLRAFENPRYLIRTAYRPNNELGATRVSFFPGKGASDLQKIDEWAQPVPLTDAIEAATEHMDANGIASRSVIQIVAPLHDILDPPPDAVQAENNYALVYRERNRACCLEEYRILKPRLRDILLEVKGRASQAFQLVWFENVDEKFGTIEFPALRAGSCTDPESRLGKLLQTLMPFAAVTRLSIRSAGAVNENDLADAIGNQAQFANIPLLVQQARNRAGSILPHITIIWDDPELPKGYWN